MKALVRPGREPALRTMFPRAPKSQLVAVEVSSMVDGDYTTALQGVTAVIHLAVPNPLKGASSKEVLSVSFASYCIIIMAESSHRESILGPFILFALLSKLE